MRGIQTTGIACVGRILEKECEYYQKKILGICLTAILPNRGKQRAPFG